MNMEQTELPLETAAPPDKVAELAAAVKGWSARKMGDKLQPRLEDTIPIEDKSYWPGKINYAGERGSYSGCKLEYFATARDVNVFFEAHPKCLVVDMKPTADESLYVLYTVALSPEEQEEFSHFSQEVESKMAEWRKARREGRENAYIEKMQALEELTRLAQVGQRYEQEVQPNLKQAKADKKAEKKKGK